MNTERYEEKNPAYRGRFAPSPTGPLHAGSLASALASFLDAKSQQGTWQLRIDDIDPPRAVEGSIPAISDALIAHGLLWDGPILYQSSASAGYDSALDRLSKAGWLFRCICTRSTLTARSTCGQGCAGKPITSDTTHSIRVKVDHQRLTGFEDRFLGYQACPPGEVPEDFIVKRRDGLYAYQLAAAVDDARPRFTHIVRGADLLTSTHRQRWLQDLLALQPPSYGHVPVVLDVEGHKLSKQTGAPALDINQPEQNLRISLLHLNQRPPPDSARTVSEILQHALEHWK